MSLLLSIIVSPHICQLYNNLAEGLLKQFVSLYSSLYGEHLVTYNVHNLLHLPRFVKIHGSLDNFSCFKYEKYLQEIKKSIKSVKYPLQEITNRIKEKQNIFVSTPLKPFQFKIIKGLENRITSKSYLLIDKPFKKLILKNSNILYKCFKRV
jgi:hypothetical protein